MTARLFTHAFPSVTLALLVGGCGAGASEPSSADAEPLASAGALTSSEILGSIACGETLTAAYTGRPAYRAYAFKGSAGQAVAVAVDGSTNATAEAWLLRSDFSQVTSSAATADASFHATLAKSGTYYVAFRNKTGAAETFEVSVACPSALDGGFDGGRADSGSPEGGDDAGADADAGNVANVDGGTGNSGSADSGTEDTGAAGCATGQTLCGASCVDTTSDPANCGACGSACESGQTCAGGTCTPPDPFSASFCASTGAPMTTSSAAAHVPAGGWQATIGRYAQITRVRTCASLTGCAPWTSAAPFDTSYLTTVYFPNLTAYFPDAGDINLYVNGSSVELLLQSDPGVYANAPSSAGYMDQSLVIAGAPTYSSSVNFGPSSESTIEFIGSDVEASSFPSAITLTDHCVQSVIDASNAGNQDPWTEVQTVFYGTF